MTITAFDRQNLRTLRQDINEALAEVAEKHGIMLDIGNIRFDSDNFRTKLEGNVKQTKPSGLTLHAAPTGPVPSADEIDFDAIARQRTLPDNMVGAKFRAGGTTYTLTAVKSSRYKYPFSGTGPKGGRYKFSVNQVRNGWVG